MGTILAEALDGSPPRFSGFKPHPMPDRKVLYRSVSLPELLAIWRSEVITGGGNLFNMVDDRPDVLFADEISDRLIRQGEYVDRQITFALSHHEVSRRCDARHAKLDEHRELILSELAGDGISYDPEHAEDFRTGFGKRQIRKAAFRRGAAARRKFGWLFRTLHRLEADCEAANTDYDREYAAALSERVHWLSSLPISSAVLVTRPITGGLVYAAEHGWCGHEEREYGFAPGQVTLADIAEIIFIKACREVERCCPCDLAERLRSLNLVSGRAQLARLEPDARLLVHDGHLHATFPRYYGAPPLKGARVAGLRNPVAGMPPPAGFQLDGSDDPS